MNCDEPLSTSPNYCHRCGQRNRPARLDLKYFIAEFFNDYFSVNSKLFQTIYLLVFKPGRLTLAFCEGKRVSFIQPFRLYLLISFSYFFVLALTLEEGDFGEGIAIQVEDNENSADVLDGAQLERAFSDSAGWHVDSLDQTSIDFKKWVVTQQKRVENNPGEFKRRLFRAGSYAVFFLLPLFALLLKITHFRRAPFYVDHLVHSTHIHAFLFLIFLLFNLITVAFSNPGYGYLIASGFGYLIFSLRYVYKQSFARVLLKVMFLVPVYAVFIILALVSVALISFALV